MRAAKIWMGFVVWLALIGGLTWLAVSSQQPPSEQHHQAAAQTTDKPAEENRTGVSATEEKIADYTWWLTFFTAILGASTIGLWLTSIITAVVQRRDTQAAIKLARDEFVATHRPRIVVRGIRGPFRDLEDYEFIWLDIANAGDTPAAIRSAGHDLIRRDPNGNWQMPGLQASPEPFFAVLVSGQSHTFVDQRRGFLSTRSVRPTAHVGSSWASRGMASRRHPLVAAGWQENLRRSAADEDWSAGRKAHQPFHEPRVGVTVTKAAAGAR